MTCQPSAQHLISGQIAEQLAATFLQKKGLTLVERNFRCPYGEIDLIMRDHCILVFIEVRLRKNDQFGGAAISITPAKQQKLTRTAQRYLQIHGEAPCRFDAILMQATKLDAIEWIRNAF
ncbi:MAG: YraN family protein [Betaproteobacteria bacterium]|nr:YraN family protein [Betaproteobacteria bacterium]